MLLQAVSGFVCLCLCVPMSVCLSVYYTLSASVSVCLSVGWMTQTVMNGFQIFNEILWRGWASTQSGCLSLSVCSYVCLSVCLCTIEPSLSICHCVCVWVCSVWSGVEAGGSGS